MSSLSHQKHLACFINGRRFQTVEIDIGSVEADYIDTDRGINLFNKAMKGVWNIVHVKHTEDLGIIAKTGYRMRQKQLQKKLKTAEKIYGF